MTAADHGTVLHRFSQGRPERQIFQRLTTSDLPAPERYDYWRESVISIAEADPPTQEQRRDFAASLVSFAAPRFELHFAASDGFCARLSRSAAARYRDADPSFFYVVCGDVRYEEEDSDLVMAGAGDFFLWDPGRAATVAFGRTRFVQLDLPRGRLLAELGFIPDGTSVAQALRGSRLSAFLKAQLETLQVQLAHLPPPEQVLALETTQALAVSVLKGALAGGGLDGAEQNRRRALFSAARQYIHHRLSDPALNAEAVAAALGCSRSSLYRAFLDHGAGVADYIRDQRLQRLRVLLQGGQGRASIADLAAECGLYDAPNISRMFRARFGLSPSEYRRQNSVERSAMG